MSTLDNPAYADAETAANNQHAVIWGPLFNSGAVGGDNAAMRLAHEKAGGLVRTANDAAIAMTDYLDSDDNLVIDPVATAATAGTPGSFTGTAPLSLGALRGLDVLPSPVTTWTTGQHVVLGDASHAYWTQVSVPATTGAEATDDFSSTAHGLVVGDPVIFTATTGGTGISTNTVYRVASVPDANSFTLETQAGAALTFTTDLTVATTITGTWSAGEAA